MKYKFLTVFVAGIVLSLPPVAEKIAQAIEQNEIAQADQSVVEVRESSDSNDKRQQYQEAKEQRQAELAERLDERRTQAIANRCAAAQAVLARVSSNAETSYSRHQSIIEGINTRLNDLQTRLDGNFSNLDTSTLEAAIIEFSNLSTEFMADFEIYVGAVQESAQLENCQDDPESFHLALETAKELRSRLKTLQSSLREILQTDVKSAIQGIREDFVDSQSDNGNEETLERVEESEPINDSAEGEQ